MQASKAQGIKEQIIALCEGDGIWFDINEQNRPKLGKIIIEISIKVDNDE